MYKSLLQEHCQKKAWLLPEYSTTREGHDHCPKFKASVIVNGSTFATSHLSKSSKDAQNLVAKIAFQHLTASDVSATPPASHVAATPPASHVAATPPASHVAAAPPASHVAATSSAFQQSQPGEAVQSTLMSEPNATSRDDKKHRDMLHIYKNQLQIYCQKRNLTLPAYVSEREGPPHALRFKCKVNLEGKFYECQEYFCTLKDAENAAAKVALMSVSSVGIEEEDLAVFKNLLQELAQKEYSCLPEYNTNSSGPSHMPLFISTVEIKGESFAGQASKTKKLAEMYAAKAAYSALKERKSTQNSKHVFQGSHVDDAPQVSVPAPSMGPNVASSEHAMYNQGAYQNPAEPYHAVAPHDTAQNTSGLKPEELPFSRAPSHSPTYPAQPPSNSGLSGYNTPWAGTNASSAHKVRVLPRELNMTLPPGAVITHEDENWIAVAVDSIHSNA